MAVKKELNFWFFLFLLLSIADFSWVIYYCSWPSSSKTGFYKDFFPFFKCIYLFFIGGCWWNSVEERDKFVIIYLILAAVGDFFLEMSGFLYVLIGGIGFAASHIFVILALKPEWKKTKWYYYFLGIPGYSLHLVSLAPMVIQSKIQNYVFLVYTVLLCAGYTSSIAREYKVTLKSFTFWMCYFGYFFYLLSDYILFRRMIGRRINNLKGYEVMGTYYIAHSLLISGIIVETSKESSISPNPMIPE